MAIKSLALRGGLAPLLKLSSLQKGIRSKVYNCALQAVKYKKQIRIILVGIRRIVNFRTGEAGVIYFPMRNLITNKLSLLCVCMYFNKIDHYALFL